MDTELFYVWQFCKMLFKVGVNTGLILIPALVLIKLIYLMFAALNHRLNK